MRPVESLLVPKPWHRGRVVLIGDAAHATSPHVGQGGAMAMEDAIVLAEEVTRGTARSRERYCRTAPPALSRDLGDLPTRSASGRSSTRAAAGGRLRRADDEVRPRHLRPYEDREGRDEGRRACRPADGEWPLRPPGCRILDLSAPESAERTPDCAARLGPAAPAARTAVDPRLPDVRAARRGWCAYQPPRKCTRAGTRSRRSTSPIRTRSSARTTTSPSPRLRGLRLRARGRRGDRSRRV